MMWHGVSSDEMDSLAMAGRYAVYLAEKAQSTAKPEDLKQGPTLMDILEADRQDALKAAQHKQAAREARVQWVKNCLCLGTRTAPTKG